MILTALKTLWGAGVQFINPRMVMIIVVLVSIIASYIYHIQKVYFLEKELNDMKTKYSTLLESTSIQNAEINRLHVIGQQYASVIKHAVDKNAATNKMWGDVIGWINKEPIPSDCEGAMSHLKSTIRTLGNK